MSGIEIVMDGLLIVLILTAIGFGLRLEKKLKALREGQASFGLAVGELNVAASKAHSALAELRAAGEETDMLHERILAARQLKADLEGLTARGRAAPARAEPALDALAAKVAAIQPPAAPARLLQALAERRVEDMAHLFAEVDADPRRPETRPEPRSVARPTFAAAPRDAPLRASVQTSIEDDLFEPQRLSA